MQREQCLFLSVYVDDMNLAGRKENLNTMWEKLMKLVDLGEPPSFLDHVYFGCTQRERKSNERIIEEDRKMFVEHSRNLRIATVHLTHHEHHDMKKNDSTTLQSINSLH